MTREEQAALLAKLFGEYRREWGQELFRTLFRKPPYFETLVSNRPCLLFGGRGTGKTTALRSLRFDAAVEADGQVARSTNYLGLYLKMNKNRVRVFEGKALSNEDWAAAFAHYFNLIASLEFCDLWAWLVGKEGVCPMRQSTAQRLADALAVGSGVGDLEGLRLRIQSSIGAVEIFANNVRGQARPSFSVADAPLVAWTQELDTCGALGGRSIYCCIDEYENLTDLQQSVLNGYIKNAEPPISYKIGARQGGLRSRHTIDQHDQLVTPDDYVQIDIAEEPFDDFALDVARVRLSHARDKGINIPGEPEALLPALSRRDEAAHLGAPEVAAYVISEVEKVAPGSQELRWLNSQPPEDIYLIRFFADMDSKAIADIARRASLEPDWWRDKINNYGVAGLFWLSRGRKGARVHKYYCGVRSFLAMASGNIRYFLELIDLSISIELQKAEDGRELVVSPIHQTEAARAVGARRLRQVEGLGEYGFDIKRYLLVLGKVFFECARSPDKSPETTSFVVSGPLEAVQVVSPILQQGVMNLAFQVAPRTKATSQKETKDDEYRLHPIFAAFFEYSYRRKRRMTIPAESLMRLREHPAQVIKGLLAGVPETEEADLPKQLRLFWSFYEGQSSGGNVDA